MTSLADVSHEIARTVEHQRRVRRRLLQERRRLALVDALLSDLEELHLQGKRRVPLNYGDRLHPLHDAPPPSPPPAPGGAAGAPPGAAPRPDRATRGARFCCRPRSSRLAR